MNSAINQKSDSILSTVSSTYTTKADFNNDKYNEKFWNSYNKAFGIAGTIHITDSHDQTEHKGQSQA